MAKFELDKQAPFYVAGHSGMVGSAIWRVLEKNGFTNLVGRSSRELDLTDRQAVFDFVRKTKPRYLILAAAKVGGIVANDSNPVQFLSENLQIQVNVMDAALESNVERLMFLGSSCIYPKNAPQPLKEDYLLSGPLEETNDAYAIAKLAGIKQVQSVRKQYKRPWISVLPTNLYGPGDNYAEGESHVMAALLRRFFEAKRDNISAVTNWGTGRPLREFMHVDDLAEAIYSTLERYDDDLPLNLGSGEEISIRDLSDLIQELIGYKGQVIWDESKPDGVLRKRLDRSRAPDVQSRKIEDGIMQTIEQLTDADFIN